MNYLFTYADDLSEPITLDEAKNYLKLDFDTDDDLITQIITSAREQAEIFCNRSFVPKTIELSVTELDFPILLPFPNHAFITEAKIDGEVFADYSVTGISQFEMTLNSGFTAKELRVIYEAGINVTKAEKEAIKKVIADMYRNRDESESLSENAKAYLMPFKVYQ
jgi:hypothetical protein